MGYTRDGPFLDLAGLGEDEGLLRQEVHRIAVEVLRPAAWALDRMTPERADRARLARSSRRWPPSSRSATTASSSHRKRVVRPSGSRRSTQSVVLEELGWGSLGLATAFLVDMLPVMCMANFGSDESSRPS